MYKAFKYVCEHPWLLLCIQACEGQGQDACQTKWRTAGKKSSRHISTIFMAETEQSASFRPNINSKGRFQVFGFGYNGFTQFGAHKSVSEDDQVAPLAFTDFISESSLFTPLPLNVDRVSSIAASWPSTFYLKGE